MERYAGAQCKKCGKGLNKEKRGDFFPIAEVLKQERRFGGRVCHECMAKQGRD